jgi:ferredoxin-type protein NapG
MTASTMARRGFLSRVARATGLAALVGTGWAYVLQQESRASPFALRPPGALSEPDFAAKCIKCGKCVAACPFDTLHLARVGDPYPIGTPFFVPRDTPCYMCPDIPCVPPCPTGALDHALVDIAEADMGLAVLIDQENCLSYRGLRCEICHRVCPVSNSAITVVNHPRRLSRHAVFVPVVHSEHCTGCGICESRCPTEVPTIKVLPRRIAMGRIGAHYRLGWEHRVGITQQFEDRPAAGEAPAPAASEPPSGGALDYLNADDGL